MPILALRGVNKSFGPIDVLHDISLEVRARGVLRLFLGDNRRCDPTLIKIMSGVHQPTSAVSRWTAPPSPAHPARGGRGRDLNRVHQFGGTFPQRSIGRSFFVGVEP